MAFHVACPLTCRKICNCTLGASGPLRKFGGKEAFIKNALALQRLVTKSPLMITTGEDTVEVLVPRLSKELKKKKKKQSHGSTEADVAVPGAPESEVVPESQVPESEVPEPEPTVKEQSKTVVDIPDDQPAADNGAEASTPPQVQEANVSSEQVSCGLCLHTENMGSKKHERLLTCEGCERRFHRECVKQWAAHRDLFNWASWRCAYCRTCEDCKATGDPNRLLFCKRCDAAHHTNCKQTGAKVPAKGPYLCPKHAQCHSCGTRVPGGGSSSRWFHSYLFCDACGRLFVKNKYCPICLKVYRESEPTPMVCCDLCEHWVHCVCEGISDEKYQEFQINSNLRFTCAACRGDSFQATSVEDAIGELWRRKDEADREQISRSRAAAGLPSEEEMAKICPSSDDEVKEQPAKEASKKEGKWVIKINVKKGGPEQKAASSKETKNAKAHKNRGGKSKVASNESTEATNFEKTQDVEEGSVKQKKSKKKKQGPEDEKVLPTQSESSKKSLKVKAPADDERPVALSGKSGTKITLHVPAKKIETREETSASEGTHTDDLGEQQSEEHVQSWEQHSESRRRRLPSSKYRDMDTTAGTPASSKARGRTNEDSAEGSRKRAKLGASENTETEAEKQPLKLKSRKQLGTEVEASSRGQRSKRKRSLDTAEEPPAEEVESDEDDTSILQRLGVDAVAKRVEVCRASDKAWLKGTIASVNQRRSQFTINYDNGEKKTQKYGKEKVRLLGKK